MNNEKISLTEYELKRILGRGTFSKVKLCLNRITKEKFAIKIIDKQFILNKNNYDRIKREIYIMKKTNHPNIIKVHDIKEDSKNYYIVMEYCKYGELFQQIINNKHFDSNIASFYFFQLINGLHYLHSNKIIHRDLKPENLLIAENNILKIIDFGLSNFCNQNEYLNTPCGSPSYAPPEMIEGNKYDGMFGDIWSCGVILYVMLCGYLPFDGKNNNDLFNKILKCKVNYPKNMDNTAVDLLKNILVANPQKRFNIDKIKKHLFYLKGKKIFEEKNPDLITIIENKNNVYEEIRNSFIKYNNELERRNKLETNIIGINIINNKFKDFENQKENQNINDYIYQNDNKNYKDSQKECNLYKSNLLLRTKNINYYKRILTDRLNIQQIKSPKNKINTKNIQNNHEINNLKNFPSMKNKININTSLNTTNKNESAIITKMKGLKEKSVQKRDNIILTDKDNFPKNKNYFCKNPNHLIIRHFINDEKVINEEEKNVNEIIKVQREKQKFHINSTTKKENNFKKVYKNEIKNFSGDKLRNNLEYDDHIKRYIDMNRAQNIDNLPFNYQMSLRKNLTPSFKNTLKRRTEEINKNNFDDNYNKQNLINNKKVNKYNKNNTFYKNKNLSLQSPKSLYHKNSEHFFTEKNKSNIYYLQSNKKELFHSHKKESLYPIQVYKINKEKKQDKNTNKYKLANKLYRLSTIKKNFNTCNDILNSTKAKEEFKNYIISHNKINQTNNPPKYINNKIKKINLNQSENKNRSVNKSNSIMIDKKERFQSKNKNKDYKSKNYIKSKSNNKINKYYKNTIIKEEYKTVDLEKRISGKFISKEKFNKGKEKNKLNIKIKNRAN